MNRLISLIILMLGFSFASYAEEAAAPAAENPVTSGSKDTTYMICKNKSAVRTLRVEKRKNGTCFTTYTKNGVDQTVSNTSDLSRCQKVLVNIQENLEKANWKCKDISEARVSSSE